MRACYRKNSFVDDRTLIAATEEDGKRLCSGEMQMKPLPINGLLK